MLAALPAASALVLMAPGTASAEESYEFDLSQLNSSGASGTAQVQVDDNKLHVSIEAQGLVPNAPHAQHFHGSFSENTDFACPPADLSRDKNGDGVVSTAEAIKDYGDIVVSLTTKGDTGKKSGLAVDRFPTADADGNLSYERTITLDQNIEDTVKNLHIVQHGIDANGNGEYDGKKSELDPSLPQEATAPADCGMVTGAATGATPVGGVETGGEPAQGPSSLAMVGLGGAALAGAAGTAFVARRRRAGESG